MRAIEKNGNTLNVALRPVDGGGTPETLCVDVVLAHCGFRPELTLARELQVHQCYATEGPMALAAALMSARGGATDCLVRTATEADTIKNPEVGFFVIGHKSYGRRNDYLLQVALEQIRDVFRWIEDDDSLDLYENDAAAESA